MGRKVEGDRVKGTECMMIKEWISLPCAGCFGMAIACSNQHCMEACACSRRPPYESRSCHYCVQTWCQKLLAACTGLPSSASSIDYDHYVSSDVNSSGLESYITV